MFSSTGWKCSQRMVCFYGESMIIPILTRWAQNSLQSSTNELLWINLSSFWGPPKINARGFRRGSGTRKEHDSFQAMELGPVTRANDFPWTIFCQAWYSIPCNLDIASLSLWYPGMNPSQIPKLMLLSSWLKRHEQAIIHLLHLVTVHPRIPSFYYKITILVWCLIDP